MADAPSSAAYQLSSEIHIWGGQNHSWMWHLCWYDRRYSISSHPWNDWKEVNLIHPPAWSLPRRLQGLKSFYFVSSLSTHFWSIKEPHLYSSIQDQTRCFFWSINLPTSWSSGSRIKSPVNAYKLSLGRGIGLHFVGNSIRLQTQLRAISSNTLATCVIKSKLALLTTELANKLDELLRQRIATVFGKPTGQEDDGLVSQRSILPRWDFLDASLFYRIKRGRWGGRVKKDDKLLQTFPVSGQTPEGMC